ncbi:MAG TPA: DUF58 domain-containing protein [Candidatus Dormibacteraeota bacterium]|nr:DUF58 domain-containing protein [Candidatus Dormibacteraeota bacterium]
MAYAVWNRGVRASWVLRERAHAQDFDVDLRAGQAVADSAFEGDTGRLDVTIRSRGRTVGPARASGKIGGNAVAIAAGRVTRAGHTEHRAFPPLRRGPIMASDWRFETSDPLGLFRSTVRGKDVEQALVLPRFTSLHAQPVVRELEASVVAPRAGGGTEIFGVREYRPGDPLRRIHWRSTARRGELIVREFEPPGVQNLGIFLDPNPASVEVADQIARLAASEAWDCLRAGGRVRLWAPGSEPTRPDVERNFLALLEWLARYPKRAPQDEPPPLVGDAIAVTAGSDARLLEAVEDVRLHGGVVRAWVVGEATLESDIDAERVGLGWPL